jgi:hypothetical protein
LDVVSVFVYVLTIVLSALPAALQALFPATEPYMTPALAWLEDAAVRGLTAFLIAVSFAMLAVLVRNAYEWLTRRPYRAPRAATLEDVLPTFTSTSTPTSISTSVPAPSAPRPGTAARFLPQASLVVVAVLFLYTAGAGVFTARSGVVVPARGVRANAGAVLVFVLQGCGCCARLGWWGGALCGCGGGRALELVLALARREQLNRYYSCTSIFIGHHFFFRCAPPLMHSSPDGPRATAVPSP